MFIQLHAGKTSMHCASHVVDVHSVWNSALVKYRRSWPRSKMQVGRLWKVLNCQVNWYIYLGSDETASLLRAVGTIPAQLACLHVVRSLQNIAAF